MDDARKLWDYVNQDRSRILKLNEEGKKLYFQYGYDTKQLDLNKLTDEAKKYIAIKPPSKVEVPSISTKVNAHERAKVKTPSIRQNNPALTKTLQQQAPAPLLGFADSAFLGLPSKSNPELYDQKRQQSPIGMGIGQLAGFILPGVSTYKTVGQAAGNLAAKKISSRLGQEVVKGLAGGAVLDVGMGLVEGDSKDDLLKRMGRGAAIGAAVDVATFGIGKGLKRLMPGVSQGASAVDAPEQRILQKISIGGKDKTRKMTLARAYTLTLDEQQPIKRAVDKIAGGAKIATSDNPYELAVLNRGWQGKAESYLKYGIVDDNFTKVGKSFEEVIKPVSNELDNFRAFAIAKRAKELDARGIKSGLEMADIDSTIQKFSTKYEPVLKELIEYQDNVLKQLEDTGILSKEALQQMRELNKDYVPFYRVIDEISKGGTGKGYQARNPVKAIKGSEKEIVDPLESIIKNTYVITNMAERNRVGRALVDLGEKFGTELFEKVSPKIAGKTFGLDEIKKALEAAGADTKSIDLDSIATIFRPIGNNDPGVISVFKNGKAEYIKIKDEELYRAMLSLDKETTSTLVKMLSFPAKMLRAGATLNPEFAFRNPTRDAHSAFIYSKYGFVPGVDSMRGLFHALKKDDLYYKWISSGGANSAMVSLDRDYLQKNLRELLQTSMKDKTLNIIKNPIELMRAFSELTEQATRLGEFSRGVAKEGMTGEGIRKAALSSRDVTLDFARSGTATKQMNKVTAFFNAQLQGVDKMARAFKDNPMKSTTKAVTGITLPSIYLYQINKNDPRYQELPQWQKDLFWIIPTKKRLYRIPKPFELGLLFGTIPERVMEWIDTNDKQAFEELGTRIAGTITPNIIPTALLPYIEAITNYSFFTGRPIVSQGEQRLEPSEQFGNYTSETAKLIGKGLNISPKKVDNTIKGYFGGLGRYGTDAIDMGLKKTGIAKPNVMPKEDVTSYPVVRGFTTRPYTGGSESVDRFYSKLEKLEKAYQTQKNSNEIRVINQFENGQELRKLRRVSAQISDYRQQINAIYKNNKLDEAQKRIKIDDLNIKIINLSRKALGKDKIERGQ